jgi:23S rRNA (guanosine2251-2'-O)-methyltransferase
MPAPSAGIFYGNSVMRSRKKSAEKETWIGGFHAVIALLEAGEIQPREILIASTRQDARARRVTDLAEGKGVTVRTVSKSDLDLKAPGLRHQGVLACTPVRELGGEELLQAPSEDGLMFLALDGVQDPHNLGACLRSAEAAGVSAVIIPKDRAAGLTPVARKTAAGAAERLPVVAVTNLVRELEKLKERGYWVLGLAGDAEEELYDIDFSGPVVVVMGGESDGLRRLTRDTCDRVLRIPMHGEIESLNVSVATAVVLYEALRQRDFGDK